jgi:hypothetical protein
MKNQKLEINNDIDNENEQMVLKIIGKLSPFIDKFDSLLLSRSMDLEERNQTPAELVIYALSPNSIYLARIEQINYS